MKPNFIINMLGIVLLGTITACIKDSVEPLGDAGKTLIKFNDAPSKSLFFSPFNETKKINLFNLRRDPNSDAELNMSISVTVKLDQQIIDKYNTDNGTNYEALPADFFTYSLDQGVTKNADNFTFNFAPGDFAKNFSIMLDGSKWTNDLSKKYAFAFVISDAGGQTLTSGKDSMLVFLSIKNKWDGVYEVNGSMVDVTNPALQHVNVGLAANGEGPLQMELRTISATKCAFFDPVVVGNFASPIWSSAASGFSQYGSFSVIVEFDPNSDNLVAVTNYAGQPAANSRYGQLDPSGVNTYDPATKTITIKYNMCQPSVIPLAPHIRTTWDEKWKFIKERE